MVRCKLVLAIVLTLLGACVRTSYQHVHEDSGGGDDAGNGEQPPVVGLARYPEARWGAFNRVVVSEVAANLVYALDSADRRLFRSTDGGDSWTECETLPPVISSVAAMRDAAEAIVASAGGQLWISRDRCASWTRIEPKREATALLALSEDKIWAGAVDSLWVYDGSSWKERKTAIGGERISSIVADASGQRLFAASLGHGIVTSDDGGQSWKLANSGLSSLIVLDLAIDPSDPSRLLAATKDGAYHTTDGGANWTRADAPVYSNCYSVAIDPNDTDRAALSSVKGVFSSSDGGATFDSRDRLSGWLSKHRVLSVRFSSKAPSRLYAAGYRSIGRHDASSGSWTWNELGAEVHAWSANSVTAATDGTLYAATWGALVATDDGGASWRRNDRSFLPPYVLVLDAIVDPEDDATIYAAGKGIFRSIDGGISFEELWSQQGWATHRLAKAGERIYGAWESQLVVSNDNGTNWQSYPSILGAERRINDILAWDEDPPVVLLATETGVFNWKSKDSEAMSGGLPSTLVHAIVRAPDGAIVVGTEEGAAVAVAVGATFVGAGLEGKAITALWVDAELWVAGTRQSGLWVSKDRGDSWSELPGLQGKLINDLHRVGSKIWIATSSYGLFTHALD